jgi:hypothetical protein
MSNTVPSEQRFVNLLSTQLPPYIQNNISSCISDQQALLAANRNVKLDVITTTPQPDKSTPEAPPNPTTTKSYNPKPPTAGGKVRSGVKKMTHRNAPAPGAPHATHITSTAPPTSRSAPYSKPPPKDKGTTITVPTAGSFPTCWKQQRGNTMKDASIMMDSLLHRQLQQQNHHQQYQYYRQPLVSNSRNGLTGRSSFYPASQPTNLHYGMHFPHIPLSHGGLTHGSRSQPDLHTLTPSINGTQPGLKDETKQPSPSSINTTAYSYSPQSRANSIHNAHSMSPVTQTEPPSTPYTPYRAGPSHVDQRRVYVQRNLNTTYLPQSSHPYAHPKVANKNFRNASAILKKANDPGQWALWKEYNGLVMFQNKMVC